MKTKKPNWIYLIRSQMYLLQQEMLEKRVRERARDKFNLHGRSMCTDQTQMLKDSWKLNACFNVDAQYT